MMTNEDAYRDVIVAMGQLIWNYSRSLASEQSAPGRDADMSDDRIADLKRKINELRNIRESFENCVNGVIL